jgi:hypothetical protein
VGSGSIDDDNDSRTITSYYPEMNNQQHMNAGEQDDEEAAVLYDFLDSIFTTRSMRSLAIASAVAARTLNPT